MAGKTSKNKQAAYGLYKSSGKWLENKIKRAERHCKNYPGDVAAAKRLDNLEFSEYNRDRRNGTHVCKADPTFRDTPASISTIVEQFVALGFTAPPPKRKYYGKNKRKNTSTTKAR
jgi:hypothetical protein